MLLLALVLAAGLAASRVSEVTAWPLSSDRLAELARLPLSRLASDTRALATVRVAGTPGAAAARSFLVGELRAVGGGWRVEEDSFSAPTPLGTRSFANVVATFNPASRARRVVAAAHYDSKFFAEPNTFVGATDSAVPCAMLLDLARVVARSPRAASAALALQLVFFDGEEAFRAWSNTDSTYGSRHLAGKWAAEGTESENAIEKLDLFVLLDLIGAPNPRFYNAFPATSLQYKEMVYLSRQLKKKGLLHENSLEKSMFGDARALGIEDDHIPFLRLGVPIMHLIASPFPPGWHTPADNLESLSTEVIEDLMVIFRVFFCSILNL